MIRRSWLLLLLFALCGAGCSSCFGESRNAVAANGFKPCLSFPPNTEGHWDVGDLAVGVDGRHLTLAGTGEPLKMAVFSGPAPGPGVGLFADLSGHDLDLALCLGGVGDDAAAVSDALEHFARLPFLVLILPGGRDDPTLLAKGWKSLSPEQQSGIVLLTGIEKVSMPGHEIAVVSGSEEGQYARRSSACGYSTDALAGLADKYSQGGGSLHRSIWAWMAPGGGGAFAVGRTHLGLDVGSRALANFADTIGAKSGLFAWPGVRAAQPATGDGVRPVELMESQCALRLVPPRLGAFPSERSDGSRVPPGFVILSVESKGFRLIGRVEARVSSTQIDTN